MIYNEDSGTVIYHSKMTHGKDKKNFEVYSAVEFIAAITQHIPDKAFQMVRYYGWYSNKTRGIHEKESFLKPGAETEQEKDIEIIDVSDYQPKRIPPKTWRECIKKIYEIDPLICRHCGGEMKIIVFITDHKVIRQILEHLGVWKQKSPRAPPPASRPVKEITYEYGDDYTPDYVEPFIQIN